jgi:hypothetical protein
MGCSRLLVSVLFTLSGSRSRLIIFQKCVLVLMLIMAVASPFLQIDSLDRFPVNTDDFELQVICCLCMLGMFLVFTAFITLAPLLRLADFSPPLPDGKGWRPVADNISTDSASPPFAVPLRI